MAFSDPTTPNITDYTTFIRNAGFDTTVLPDGSEWIQNSFDVAYDIVNPDLAQGSSLIYVLAVYNLGVDRLINYAIDVSGQTYFADLRKSLNLLDITVGVIDSGSDQGTSAGIANPEQMKLLTFQDLQTLKTPYGRQYMAFAQMYGQTLWGLT